MRLLVVDDDEDVRTLVNTWLRGLYTVDTAVDGNDCLAKLSAGNKYDIILLDVMMPGPKPAELIERIMAQLPSVRIIYLTAVEMFNPTAEQERKGFQPVITSAVKGYLVKPIEKEQLVNKISEVLETEQLLKPKAKPKTKKPAKKK
jgi:CheY-like chemotaxis protein